MPLQAIELSVESKIAQGITIWNHGINLKLSETGYSIMPGGYSCHDFATLRYGASGAGL